MSQIKQDLKIALIRLSDSELRYNQAVIAAANFKGSAQSMKMLANECLDLMRLLVSATELRPEPGIYFLMNKLGEIIYVGQSENVMCRMSGHKEKDFYSARMVKVKRADERLRIETRFIHLLRPPINLQYLGVDGSHELLQKEFELS